MSAIIYWELPPGVTRGDAKLAAEHAGIQITIREPNHERALRDVLKALPEPLAAHVWREERGVVVWAINEPAPSSRGSEAVEVNRVAWRRKATSGERIAFAIQNDLADDIRARHLERLDILSTAEARALMDQAIEAPLAGTKIQGRVWLVHGDVEPLRRFVEGLGGRLDEHQLVKVDDEQAELALESQPAKPRPPARPKTPPQDGMEDHSVRELRELARAAGIKPGTMRKPALIEAVRAARDQP